MPRQFPKVRDRHISRCARGGFASTADIAGIAKPSVLRRRKIQENKRRFNRDFRDRHPIDNF